MASPALILLPGLDGTGRLFRPLIEKLPPSVKTEVVCPEPRLRSSVAPASFV